MSRELEVTSEGLIRMSYSMLGTLLVLLFGFATWMAVMESRAQAHTENIGILQDESKDLHELLIGIDKRLARIETLLERSINK
jgi:Tfp pilus assembly protein PilN